MPKAKTPASDEVFDYLPGRRMLAAFIESIDVKTLSWVWAVTVDCLDVVGHHSTPASASTRRPYVGDAWLDWYASYLHNLDAQYVVHGLVREFRAACPPELEHAVRRAVEDAYRACDKRTPEQRAAAAAARARGTLDARLPTPEPTPTARPFAVLKGGKE